MKQVPFADIVKQGHSNDAKTPQEYVAEEVFRMASKILQSDQTKFVEFMEAAQNRGYFEVKLTVDGIENDPELLGVIYQNINEFIERRAGQIAAEKFKESMQEVEALGNIVEQAKNKIMEKYNIKEEE